MPLSRERQDYHLTPRGWEKGTFVGDNFGGREDVEIPVDRVLTISCYDELSSPYSKSRLYDKIVWKSDDEEKIQILLDKYSNKPDWFGYQVK
ncbi:MAG: hypothetical protein WC962_07765 [Phycisphaerae bacterium]